MTEVNGPFEREIKLRFDSPQAARTAVIALGAALARPRRLQLDALFDTASRELSARAQILRVRVEAGHSFITFKRPVNSALVKIREEIETAIDDGARMIAILESAGFHAWFRYEKYREEFILPGIVIAIDETPVGTFVEIEGSEGEIVETALGLGRQSADFILDSYRTLYVRDCESRGVAVTHMVFAAGAP